MPPPAGSNTRGRVSADSLPRALEPAGEAQRGETMLRRLAKRKRQGGSGLIVVMVLVAVMAVYLAANSSALDGLRRFLDGVEKQQVERLERAPGKAEAPPP